MRGFDDQSVQSKVTRPRLCFAGSTDTIVYSEHWGGATFDIVGPLVNQAAKIRDFTWDLQVLEGLDHIRAMQPANAPPVVRTWLISKSSSLQRASQSYAISRDGMLGALAAAAFYKNSAANEELRK